jgi:hypothetical protein
MHSFLEEKRNLTMCAKLKLKDKYNNEENKKY